MNKNINIVTLRSNVDCMVKELKRVGGVLLKGMPDYVLAQYVVEYFDNELSMGDVAVQVVADSIVEYIDLYSETYTREEDEHISSICLKAMDKLRSLGCVSLFTAKDIVMLAWFIRRRLNLSENDSLTIDSLINSMNVSMLKEEPEDYVPVYTRLMNNLEILNCKIYIQYFASDSINICIKTK